MTSLPAALPDGGKAALTNARQILLGQRDRPSPKENTYRVYEFAMLSLVVIFPLVRALVLALGIDDAISASSGALSIRFAPAVLIAVTIALVLLGRTRGPIVPPQPYLDTVVASPIAQRRSLARTARTSVFASAAIGAVIALIALGIRGIAGSMHWAGAGLFVGASALAAAQVSALWLVGQLTTPTRKRVLLGLVALLGVAIVLSLIPATGDVVGWLGPWGWVIEVWRSVGAGVTGATWVALTLLTLGLGLLWFTGDWLDELRREDLVAGSQRWDAVSMLAVNGDVKYAVNRLKGVPRLGRTWHPTFSAAPAVAIAQRDIVGVRRFAPRSVVWAAVTLVAGALVPVVLSPAHASGLGPYLVPLVLYFAVGGWMEGLRMFSMTVGSSSPYGISTTRQTLAHLIVPTAISLGLVALGVLAGGALFSELSLSGLGWALALTAFCVVMQSFAALKGLMPPGLRVPIPTPVGDLSLITVGFWLADAVIIVLIAGGWLTAGLATATLTPLYAFGLLGAAALVMAVWASARLGELARPA